MQRPSHIIIASGVLLALLWMFTMLDTKSAASAKDYSKQQYTVCTYFEALGSDEASLKKYAEMLDIWKESWTKQGWKTKILNEKDAALHPRYKEIKATLLTLPTVNVIEYELSCYLRWVAAIATGCKVLQFNTILIFHRQ